jgi:uncharacterized protein YkwD
MHVVTNARRRVAIVLAVLTLGVAAAGCLPDNNGAVGSDDPFKNQIFWELNARRRANGLADFGYSPKLELDAHVWAVVMSQQNSLYHQDLTALLYKPDHSAFWTLGENIMVGPAFLLGPEIIVNEFMKSPPHRANILSHSFNVVGVGTATSPDGRRWVSIVFGGL